MYIDITAKDGGDVLQEAIANNVGVEYVHLLKEATLDGSELIKEAFADQENRLFPIHTPEDTMASAMFIKVQSDEVPEMVKTACQDALYEFGFAFNIMDRETPEVDTLMKTASSDDLSDVMLLPNRGKLPIVDEETLYKSASAFYNEFEKLSHGEIIMGSRRLHKFASELGIDSSEFDPRLDRVMMRTPSNLLKVSEAVLDRKSIIVDGDGDTSNVNLLLQKIARERLMNNGDISFDNDFNVSLVQDIIELDKQAGFPETISLPILDVFNMDNIMDDLSKEASVEDDGFDVSLHTYDDIVKIAGVETAELICEDGSCSTQLLDKYAYNIHESVIDKIKKG